MVVKLPIESQNFEFFAVPDQDSPEFTLPFYGSRASAGFASPADDYLEGVIDLNKYLIRNASATFYARVKGPSLIQANVFDGDLLIVDKSLAMKKNSICMCILEGEFVLKFVRKNTEGKYFLVPANPAFQEIPVLDGMDFSVWGVVLHIIRTVY